jgi:4-amino-4-deoxy-L-arabinose transferase-like glycosyltransferase
MTAARWRCAALIALLGVAYAAVFVPANRTGSANVNMLGVFQVDEFAQYHAIWRMTEPAESVGAALRQFVAYDYYSYGFPFFAASALAFWPLREAYTSAGVPGLTAASMLVLRELSPLLHVLSIAILVGLWTGFRSLPRAVALFVFLAVLPAVVSDSLWWHPDACVTFFVVATIAALVRDRRRLGGWFYAAAIGCGVATATKLMGLWFFAAVAIHLARALPGRPLREVALHGTGFLVVMALSMLAASPMVFVPGEWEKVLALQATVPSIISFGWGERSSPGIAAWLPTLRSGYGGELALFTCAGLAVATVALDRARRDLAATILAFALPLSAYLIFVVAYHSERYLLPALLPLASCAGSDVWLRALRDASAPRAARVAGAAAALALAVSLVGFVRNDVARYRAVLERESASASLAFYRELDAKVISALPATARLRILRTPTVYLPPDPRFDVHLRWGGVEADDLPEANPDLILVSREDLERYGDPSFETRTNDVPRARRMYAFYSVAARDALPGYRRLLETDFALAYGRVATP